MSNSRMSPDEVDRVVKDCDWYNWEWRERDMAGPRSQVAVEYRCLHSPCRDKKARKWFTRRDKAVDHSTKAHGVARRDLRARAPLRAPPPTPPLPEAAAAAAPVVEETVEVMPEQQHEQDAVHDLPGLQALSHTLRGTGDVEPSALRITHFPDVAGDEEATVATASGQPLPAASIEPSICRPSQHAVGDVMHPAELLADMPPSGPDDVPDHEEDQDHTQGEDDYTEEEALLVVAQILGLFDDDEEEDTEQDLDEDPEGTL